MYALKVIRSHGLPSSWGFTGVGDLNRIGAFLARMKRRDFLAPQSPDLDARLFSAVVSNKNHVLRLPVNRSEIFEPRAHNDSLPPAKDVQNSIIRLQYRKFSTATQGETGWQSEKTVSDCYRYMLDKEIATDVCFEVGPPDGEVVNIRAHKYMLISRSPVFEAMFCSGMTECNSTPADHKIRIEDIDAYAFKNLLEYIYCENANITHETSFPLMYAARKYRIPNLAELCRQNLEKIINKSNACYMLEQSVAFGDEERTSKCLNIIARLSDKFLSESELLSASRETIEVILRSNELRSRESLVYEFCLRWAKEQLLINQSIKNPTDEQIRETLGGLLYQIRFPIMDSEKFIELVGQRNILSLEEKLSVNYYLTTGTGLEQLPFCSQKRNHICGKGEELCVDRVAKCASASWRRRNDAIDFITNENVVLTGFGLYSGKYANYVAEIELLEHGDRVYRDRAITVPLTDDPVPFKTSLKTPIPIMAGVKYTLSVTMPNSDIIAFHAKTVHRIYEKDGVKFTFSESPHKTGTTGNRYTTGNRCTTGNRYTPFPDATGISGQIPHLYFKKV